VKNKVSLITIYIISIIVLLISVKKKWVGHDGQYWRAIIQSDGYGYYSYLPCAFIYHSFNYEKYVNDIIDIRQGVSSKDVWNPFPKSVNNKRCDKCYVGVSVLMLPFFMIAYFLSYLLGYPLDGISYIFQIFVSIASLFYLITGLVYLRKLFKLHALSDKATAFILFLIVFGTNLLYYATMEPSMSHVFSFSLTSIFLYTIKKYSDSYKVKYLLGIVVSSSILIIIRPTNLLSVLFIPFVCGSYTNFSRFIKNLFAGWKVLPVFLLSATIIFIQPLVWYLQTGVFLVNSYPGESFNFYRPHFFDILFSYKNGWYLYTPIMFFIALGSVAMLLMKSKFQGICFLLFIIIVVYALSSWWCWWYGGFGNRAFIDFYPEFALAIGIVFVYLKSHRVWVFAVCVSFLCIFLNLFQTLQYYNFILPFADINKEKYWKVFLKRDSYYVGIFNFPDTTTYNILPIGNCIYDFKNLADSKYISNDIFYRGQHPIIVSKENPIQQIFSRNVGKLLNEKFLNLYLNIWEYMPDFDNRSAFDIKIMTAKGDCYFNKSMPLLGYASEKKIWSQAYSLIVLPPLKDSTDILNISVENQISKVYIDNPSVRFAIPK